MEKQQTFNDGVLSVYALENDSQEGDMPKAKLVLKAKEIRYEERVAGAKRFWTAKQSKVTVSKLLRIPQAINLVEGNVVVPIDEKQYEIVQVQTINETCPPCYDLSLERISEFYDFA